MTPAGITEAAAHAKSAKLNILVVFDLRSINM
jgi:hypothetical protein